jgi:hypothetical protein
MMKSGTSLLRVLVGNHPHIFSGYETHWFSPEIQLNWRDGSAKRLIWLRELYEIPPKEFQLLQQNSSSGLEFISAFMEYCTRREGKRRWAEKTPDNILHLETIWNQWPQAQVLHVRRDFRDIYASWKKNRKASLAEFLDRAKTTYRRLDRLLGHSTDNYLEVNYERLVQQPGPAMREVLEFLNEPWVEGMDRNPGDNQEYERVRQVVGVESATALALKRPIFSDSVGQWRRILNKEEVAAIDEHLDDFRPRLES